MLIVAQLCDPETRKALEQPQHQKHAAACGSPYDLESDHDSRKVSAASAVSLVLPKDGDDCNLLWRNLLILPSGMQARDHLHPPRLTNVLDVTASVHRKQQQALYCVLRTTMFNDKVKSRTLRDDNQTKTQRLLLLVELCNDALVSYQHRRAQRETNRKRKRQSVCDEQFAAATEPPQDDDAERAVSDTETVEQVVSESEHSEAAAEASEPQDD